MERYSAVERNSPPVISPTWKFTLSTELYAEQWKADTKESIPYPFIHMKLQKTHADLWGNKLKQRLPGAGRAGAGRAGWGGAGEWSLTGSRKELAGVTERVHTRTGI